MSDLWIPSSALPKPPPPQHERHCTHHIHDEETNPNVRLMECCGCWDIFISPIGIEFEEKTHGYRSRADPPHGVRPRVRRWDVTTRRWK